jgi:hypothetical protein
MQPTAPPVWLAITALIAFATLVVAAMQWVVSRNKVRLELFDKRYAIYAAVKKLLQDVVTSADSTTAQITDYWRAVADAEFLYGPEVREYIDKIGKDAAAVHAHKVIGEGPANDRKVASIEKHTALIAAMADELLKGHAARVFASYLSFSGMRSLIGFRLGSLLLAKGERAVINNAVSDEMRRVRAEIFASVFDRMMWLDTAILAAVFAAVQQGLALTPPAGAHLKRGVALLIISLALTILIPPYRALRNAIHMHRGTFKIVWESYIAQIIAALLTAVGTVDITVGLSGLLLPSG